MKTKFNYLFVIMAWLASVDPGLAQVTNLRIAPADNQIVLYWPATLANYVLQSTTNLASPNWVAVSNAVPVIAVTVTNVASASFFRLYPSTTTSDGMALIPAGPFTMGDTFGGESDAIPTVNVMASAFYMDTNLVSYSQWQLIYNWATNAGYGFDHAGSGKAANHPVYTVDWYDTVKWSNARSQQAGLIPVYYTDADFTQVYTNEVSDAVYANWAANGYRLPTEAEWEKAARGGLSGQRFPWGNTISESQANYSGCTSCFSYDLGPDGFNADFATGDYPYTSPVGYFAPNSYGLYDVAGNIFEWCWDWYGTPYAGGSDPHGPASGSGFTRVVRGGEWDAPASFVPCAFRGVSFPYSANGDVGFRCVKRL